MGDNVLIDALVRILENQITIKEHIGIINRRNEHIDNEYYYDKKIIDNLGNYKATLK